jgi:hypothetical protein
MSGNLIDASLHRKDAAQDRATHSFDAGRIVAAMDR